MKKTLYKKIFFNLLAIIFISNVNADDKMSLGLEIYNEKAMCGTCHTLQAAGSSSAIGPNLDMIKPQIPQIILAVTNGIGVMPPWEGILTKEEIEAVAHYVFNSTNNLFFRFEIFLIWDGFVSQHPPKIVAPLLIIFFENFRNLTSV